MRLCVSRQQVVDVARRWERQYGDTTNEHHKAITAQLNALDPATATTAEVAAIIGNKSWTHFTCDECSQYVEQAVELGDEYSDRKTTLCPSCARAAAALASVALP